MSTEQHATDHQQHATCETKLNKTTADSQIAFKQLPSEMQVNESIMGPREGVTTIENLEENESICKGV